MDRFARLRQIQGMDPERDYEQITRLVYTYEFPVEVGVGTELGQIHTFAISTVGELLGRTGEFTHRPVKRSDDTNLLLSEITEHGFADTRGKQAIRRINRIHAPYGISPDDFRYVLAAFVVPAVRFVEAHGWRPLSSHERTALYLYYRRLGEQMAIKDIPGSYEEMAAYMDTYEAEHAAYTDGGHQVAMANRARLAADLFPVVPARVARDLLDSLVPEHIRHALDLPRPSGMGRAALTAFLRTRRTLLRYTPPRTKPESLIAPFAERSYPGGYAIDQLGAIAPWASGCPVPHDQPSPTPQSE